MNSESSNKATGYCFKCKAKREFEVASEKDAKNKKNKIKQGKCSSCNGNISTIAGSGNKTQ